jgi:hypothetical protein
MNVPRDDADPAEALRLDLRVREQQSAPVRRAHPRDTDLHDPRARRPRGPGREAEADPLATRFRGRDAGADEPSLGRDGSADRAERAAPTGRDCLRRDLGGRRARRRIAADPGSGALWIGTLARRRCSGAVDGRLPASERGGHRPCCAYGWYCSSTDWTVSIRTRIQKRRLGVVDFASFATVVLVEHVACVRTVTCAPAGTRKVNSLCVSSRV